MIERKPSAAALARAVNLSPVSPSNEKGKFATDFCGKFNGEPFKTAAENVKFERETRAKTLALPQIKFDLNTNLNRVKNLTNQAVRAANQARANLTRSQAPKRASNLASNLTKRH
nr:hypothetical protein [uncultured Campylobacter sp.]